MTVFGFGLVLGGFALVWGVSVLGVQVLGRGSESGGGKV
jgi:hypothetical protein